MAKISNETLLFIKTLQARMQIHKTEQMAKFVEEKRPLAAFGFELSHTCWMAEISAVMAELEGR